MRIEGKKEEVEVRGREKDIDQLPHQSRHVAQIRFNAFSKRPDVFFRTTTN